MSTILDRNEPLHIEFLDQFFYKFAEDVGDGVLMWGIGKSSDNSVVMPDNYPVFERIWKDLYFAQDTNGHSFLVFDAFEKIIDLTEDIINHYKRLDLVCDYDVDRVSASKLDGYYYYKNLPFLNGHELIQLELTINNITYYGCMQVRTKVDYHSVLIVPPIYDNILLSSYYVSARRLVRSTQVLATDIWDFYSYHHSSIRQYGTRRGANFGPLYYSSCSPVEAVPKNVQLLIYHESTEHVCPFNAFVIDDCYERICPVPYSNEGSYVLSKCGDDALSVTRVDKVAEINDGESLIVKKDGMYGVCGTHSLDPVFSFISRFNEYRDYNCAFLYIEKFNKYGAYNVDNGFIISPVYDYIKLIPIDCPPICFNFIVGINNKYGVLDENGDVIVPIIYNRIDVLSYSWRCESAYGDIIKYKVKLDNLYGIYGLIEPVYEDVKLLVKSPKIFVYEDDIPYFALKEDAGWVLVDQNGALLSQDTYESIDFSKDIGCFIYKKNGETGTLAL